MIIRLQKSVQKCRKATFGNLEKIAKPKDTRAQISSNKARSFFMSLVTSKLNRTPTSQDRLSISKDYLQLRSFCRTVHWRILPLFMFHCYLESRDHPVAIFTLAERSSDV